MTKPLNYTLTAEELTTIEKAMSQAKAPEVRQRATAIRLLHQGHAPKRVAEMLAVEQATIYSWHQRWRRGGLQGLANRPKSGRPRQADEQYCRMLEGVLEQEPQTLGYAFTIWTVDRLRAHLEQQTGIGLSASRFRVLLQERGYVYRQPKHDLSALQDPAAREGAKRLLDELKKSHSAPSLNSSLWTKPL